MKDLHGEQVGQTQWFKAWTFDGTHLPVARRFSNLPTDRFNYIGFRPSLQYATNLPMT